MGHHEIFGVFPVALRDHPKELLRVLDLVVAEPELSVQVILAHQPEIIQRNPVHAVGIALAQVDLLGRKLVPVKLFHAGGKELEAVFDLVPVKEHEGAAEGDVVRRHEAAVCLFHLIPEGGE